MHDARLKVSGKLAGFVMGIGDDDDLVAGMAESGGGPVQTDGSAATLAANGVGFEARPVVDVDHRDLLVDANSGSVEEILVNGQAALIVQVRLGHRCPVNLGLAHLNQHAPNPLNPQPHFTADCTTAFILDGRRMEIQPFSPVLPPAPGHIVTRRSSENEKKAGPTAAGTKTNCIQRFGGFPYYRMARDRTVAPAPLIPANHGGEFQLVRYVLLDPELAALSAAFSDLQVRRMDVQAERDEPASIEDRFVTAICIVTDAYLDTRGAEVSAWLAGLFSRELLFFILCDTERPRESFPCLPPDLVHLILPRSTPTTVLRQVVDNAHQEMQLRLDRLRYQTRLELSQQDMRRIIRIGQLLATEKDFDVLLEKILLEAMAVVAADAGSIYVTEPYQGDRPEFLRFKKSALQLNASEFVLPIDATSVAGYVAFSGAPLRIDDCYALSGDEPYRFNRDFDAQHEYYTRSMLVVPMRNYRAEIIGVIQLINKKMESTRPLTLDAMETGRVLPFTVQDMDKCSAVAGQAAVAIENNRLINDIHNLFEGFVRASVTAIEQRDPTTSGHSFRVAEFTVGLAQAVDRLGDGPFASLKFSREQIREIRYASLLHDFGKVGVREDVLVKAKKLYPEQISEIRWKFRYARRSLELAYAEKKLRFLRENGEVAFQDYEKFMDAELQQKIEELRGMLYVVEKSNEPAVLEGGSLHQLDLVAQSRLRLEDGSIEPLLADNELLSLQVRRGNLDQRERLEIESHVTHTYRFLIQIPWTTDLKRIPDIAYGHHEKLDGTGYPLGLNAPEIGPQTRMMTISDIYDALTAPDRPYKRSLEAHEALDILQKEATEGHLDPNMLKIFIDARVYEVTRGAIY